MNTYGKLSVALSIVVASAFSMAQSLKSEVPIRVLSGVTPSGDRNAIPSEDLGSLRIHSDVIRGTQSVGQILKKYGMASDESNVRMFYRLNPLLEGQQAIADRTKITVLTPDEKMRKATKRFGTELSIDGELTTAIAVLAKNDSIRNRQAAEKLPLKSFSSLEAKSSFENSLVQVETAVEALSKRSSSLNGLELALAADRIDYVNRTAAHLTRQGGAGQTLDAKTLSSFESIVSLLKPIETGEKLTRTVTIKVNGSNGLPIKGLGVYALPGPLFDDPDAYDDSYLRARLVRYSFVEITSPSSAAVDALDARVWVGPARQYDAMIPLIRNRKLKGKYSALNQRNVGAHNVEIELRFPDDIVEIK
jgi:hypothetical protein